MGSQLTNAALPAGEDVVLADLRRGLGRDGIPIPAYQTLGVEVREATAGFAVVPYGRPALRLSVGAQSAVLSASLVASDPPGPAVRSFNRQSERRAKPDHHRAVTARRGQ